MTTDDIIVEYPAYKILKPIIGFRGVACYEDGDIIALPIETRTHGTMWHHYTFGSVAGYAIRNCEDPEAEIARCRRNMVERPYDGHKLWWLNQNAVIITNQPRPQERRRGHQWGDVVMFHGKHFTIERAPNNNAALKLCKPEEC